jgi:O-antigen/teichoic acid export membrane protein
MPLKFNVIANYLGTGWNSVMNIIFIPFYIDYLGMEAYGLIGFYTMLQICLTLLDLGMTPTLSREMARFSGGKHTVESIRDLLRSLEIICFSIGGGYCLIVWFGSDWLANNWLQMKNLHPNEVSKAFKIIGFVTTFRFFEGLYRGAIIGLQRQVTFNLVNATMATFRGLGAALVLAYIAPSIKAFFFWQGLVSLLTVIIFYQIVHLSIPIASRKPKFSIEEIKKVWKFAAGIMATTLLSMALTQVDKIILSKFLPLKNFGNYSLVSTVSNILVLLIGPISQAYYPKISELKSLNDKLSLKQAFHIGSQLGTCICGTSAFVLIFFGDKIMTIWTGKPELANEIFRLLQIMTLGTYLNSLMHMPYMLQLAHGWSSFAAKVNIVAVCLLVPSVCIITPIYGAIGAAWLWVALNSAYVLITPHFIFKKILVSEKSYWFFNDLFLPQTGSLAAICFLYGIKPETLTKWTELVYIIFAALIALGVSFLMSEKLRLKLKNYVSHARFTPS